MANDETVDQQATRSSASGWRDSVEQQYTRIKENAETYPYVWASYIVVYGGFGMWMAYKWRKLRKTENRVRILQERLRKLVEAEESAAASAPSSTQEATRLATGTKVIGKPSKSKADKPPPSVV